MSAILCNEYSLHSSISKHISAVSQGDRALQAGNYDTAECIFAQALKVAIRDNDVCLQGLCLQGMGDVYIRRGVKKQASNRRRQFTKAAALYNAAMTWAPGDQHWKDVMVHRIKYVEKCFLLWVEPGRQCQVSLPYSNDLQHKARLKNIRKECRVLLQCAEMLIDFGTSGDPTKSNDVKNKEAKWVESVRSMFHTTAGRMKDFVRQLLVKCRKTLGQPPCKYAIIGLGSMAREEMTPYSDFEFAILLEEEAKEQHKKCFRNLTSLLHLKVINLGETILPSMAIKSLNNFYSNEVEDNWLYDWKTPRGFAFDGAMPSASKTPLGREAVDGKPAVELLMTPTEMASLHEKQALAKEDHEHLSDILSTVTWVEGDKSLVEDYQGRLDSATPNLVRRALITLFDDASKYQQDIISLPRPGFQYDVKKEIYRFPTLTINSLGICLGSKRNTPWEVIDALRDDEQISEMGAHNLSVAISIATLLRLQTYLAYGRQKEGVTTLPVLQKEEHIKSGEPGLPHKLPSPALLMRFYQTNIPLQIYAFVSVAMTIPPALIKVHPNLVRQFLSEYGSDDGSIEVSWAGTPSLVKNLVSLVKTVEDPYKPLAFSQAQSGIGQNPQAHKNLHTETASDPAPNQPDEDMEKRLQQLTIFQHSLPGDVSELLGDEHNFYCKSDLLKGLIHFRLMNFQEAEPLLRVAYYKKPTRLLPCYLWTLQSLGKYAEALKVTQESTELQSSVDSCFLLAHFYIRIGEYQKARPLCLKALDTMEMNFDAELWEILIKLRLADISTNLGEINRAKELAVEIERIILKTDEKEIKRQPLEILNISFNLGILFSSLGQIVKAYSWLQKTIQMCNTIFGMNVAHRVTASCFRELARIMIMCRESDYKMALWYGDLSLKMIQNSLCSNTYHPDVIKSLNVLFDIHRELDNNEQAVKIAEKALELAGKTSWSGINKTNLAQVYTNLGKVCSDTGSHAKAIWCHEEALRIDREHYHNKPSGNTAVSLEGLGIAYWKAGNYAMAFKHVQDALHMQEDHYGKDTPRSNTAESLRLLGYIKKDMGDHSEAVRYLERSLSMMTEVFGGRVTDRMVETIQILKGLGCMPK